MLKNRRKRYFYESVTDGPTDGPTDGRTHPLIEMRGASKQVPAGTTDASSYPFSTFKHI